MKKLALLALCALAPTAASAVEMGLGASARSDEATIYLPINLNPGLRIEPFFAFSQTETTGGGVTIETEGRQVGAGGFMLMEVSDRVQPYFGGRLSYMEVETTTTGFLGSTSADSDGFRIEPAIGVDFFVTERVSVALEAHLYHEDLDDRESTGTGTRLILRIMP